MKPSKIRLLAPFALFWGSVAQAHPGHDGHELVWEYSGGHFHVAGLIWALLAALSINAAYRYVKKQG